MPGEDITKIGDLQALRALADPLRMRLLDLMSESPRTVKELAAEVGAAPNRLYYHVGVLERHGIVQVASARVVSGIVERRYEPTARAYDASHLPMNRGMAAGLASVLDSAARDVGEGLAQGRRTMISRGHFKLSPERHEELVTRMHALINEYDGSQDDDGDPLTVVVALYEDKKQPGA